MNRVEQIDVLAIQGVSSIAVASTNTARSYVFAMPVKRAVALEVVFASPGTVEVDVDIEVGNEEVGTEGAADANYAVPVGESTLISGAAAQVYIVPFSPTVSKFARVKFTGTGSNDAGTTVTRCRILTAEDN